MHLGMTRVLDPVTRDAIVSLLRNGQKIKAINMYRLSTGVSLAEAKRAVETIAAQNGIPAMMGTTTVPFPFTSVMLVLIVVLVAVALATRGH